MHAYQRDVLEHDSVCFHAGNVATRESDDHESPTPGDTARASVEDFAAGIREVEKAALIEILDLSGE